MRRLCVDKPFDWWDLGDDGNRLALLICSVCPARPSCSQGDDEPTGVIRGGVAYDDEGRSLPLCACGRPAARPGLRRLVACFMCEPPRRTPTPRKRHRRGAVDEHMEQISAWRAEGVWWEEIGRRLGLRKNTVRMAWKRHQGRPQAVSTVVDGSAS